MNRRGVTLLELLAVLFIMALIAGFSTVTFGSFTRSTKLNLAAGKVATVLRLAKSYAVSSGNDHSFNVDTAGLEEFWIEDESILPDGDIVDKKYKLPKGIEFLDTTQPAPITFSPAGGILPPVNIALRDRDSAENTRTVSVSDTAGRISIE